LTKAAITWSNSSPLQLNPRTPVYHDCQHFAKNVYGGQWTPCN
jgi:hypothetical protein